MCDFEMPMAGVQQGWQCPVCKRVYAPFVSECSYCGRNIVMNIESGTGQPHIDWCRHMSYTGAGIPKVTLNNTTIGSTTKMEEIEKLGLAGWPKVGYDIDD